MGHSHLLIAGINPVLGHRNLDVEYPLSVILANKSLMFRENKVKGAPLFRGVKLNPTLEKLCPG
jgi:hypothetical protein